MNIRPIIDLHRDDPDCFREDDMMLVIACLVTLDIEPQNEDAIRELKVLAETHEDGGMILMLVEEVSKRDWFDIVGDDEEAPEEEPEHEWRPASWLVA